MGKRADDDSGYWMAGLVFVSIFIVMASVDLGAAILSAIFWGACLAGGWLLKQISG